MDEVLRKFYDGQTEEERKKAQEIVNNTSSEQVQIKKLTISGRYLMEVATFAFEDKKTKKMRHSPEITCSPKTNALLLVINLRVVDGTPTVPKGSSIYTNITISPAAGASADKLRNTISMMKPRIVALTGIEEISLDPEWIEEYLVPTFDKVGDKYKMIKDHKMKKKVMVTVEDDLYEGKETLKVTSIMKAVEGDKSFSNSPVQAAAPNVSAPPDDASGGDTDVNAENMMDDLIPEETIVPEVANVEDFTGN